MRSKRLVLVALIAVAACRATRGWEEFDEPSWRRTEAQAWTSGSRLEIRFPAIALKNAGCMYPDTLETGVQRDYQWYATADFPGAEYPHNHFMGLYLFFTLPDAVPLTETRLDSALTSLEITVDEFAGEPAMRVSSVKPRHAKAVWDGRNVRLRIDDEAAVHEFLRARSDSIDIGWCQRDEFLTSTRVPVRTRP